MNDLTPYEQAALEFAGECAGEYLDSIGKTDLAKMTQEEWQTLISVACLNFSQKRNELTPCPF